MDGFRYVDTTVELLTNIIQLNIVTYISTGYQQVTLLTIHKLNAQKINGNSENIHVLTHLRACHISCNKVNFKII